MERLNGNVAKVVPVVPHFLMKIKEKSEVSFLMHPDRHPELDRTVKITYPRFKKKRYEALSLISFHFVSFQIRVPPTKH